MLFPLYIVKETLKDTGSEGVGLAGEGLRPPFRRIATDEKSRPHLPLVYARSMAELLRRL